MLTKDAIELFLLSGVSRGLSHHTIRTRRSSLGLLAAWQVEPGREFGDLDLKDINASTLAQYMVHLRGKTMRWENHHYKAGPQPGKLKESTIRAKSRDIRALFNWLAVKGYVAKAPTDMLPGTQYKPTDKPNALSVEETGALIEVARKWGLRELALILFLIDTGCRAGETLSLARSNLDLESRQAMVFGKGSKWRMVCILPETALALQNWLSSKRWAYLAQKCPADANYVFLGKFGTVLTYSGLSRIIKLLGKQAGIELHAHQLRHTFVHLGLQNGADVGVLSRLLGHSSIKITMDIYGCLSNLSLQQAHDQISPLRLIGVRKAP